MSRVVIVGGGGQLAHDLRAQWPSRCPGDEVISLGHQDIEVTAATSVQAALQLHQPDVVVNTSAYHRVDEVEDRPQEAFAVNATGVRHLALACRELDATLIHLSTDYVYTNGEGRPISEAAGVDPANVYGVSKAAGEMLLRTTWPKHFIVRSSGLYGVAGSSGKGGNFVEAMLRLAASTKPFKVVDDQVLTPTATFWLAAQIAELSKMTAYGTYHASCQGECSWHDFAAEIFRQSGLSPEFSRQSTAESGARAIRPAYSVLDNANLRKQDLDLLPTWQEALAGYLSARRGSTLTGDS